MAKAASRALDLSPPYRGEIADAYATPGLLALLAEPRKLFDDPQTEILFEGRNRLGALKITAGPAGTMEVVVKEYHSPGIEKLKSRFQPSKAAKAWNGACALLSEGFETPVPVAFLEKRKGRFVEQSFFIAERLGGACEIRHLFRDVSRMNLRPLLAALASTLFRLHEKGIVHRDLSDGNVLVKAGAGEFHFFFLDTNRIRRGRRTSAAARAANLVRLGIPPALRLFFLERYAEAGSRPLRRAFVVWYQLNKSVYTGWIKFKKMLRLKKLARRLKVQ